MENQGNKDQNKCYTPQIKESRVEKWSNNAESEDKLHYLAITTEDPESTKESHLEDLNTTTTIENWTDKGEENNPTLFYIAVEYVKDEKPQDRLPFLNQQLTANETYTDYVAPEVSPFDPNLSSVTSPLTVPYQVTCNGEMGRLIIHQNVTQENSETESFVNHITSETSLENLSAEVDNQYLNIIENENICENNSVQMIKENDEQEVELVITDHATGISYSVNAHELLVQGCLENKPEVSQAPNPLLFLTLEDATSNPGLSNSQISSAVVMLQKEGTDNNDIDSFCDSNLICSSAEQNKMHTRSSCVNSIEDEEKLLSWVYTMDDKPILSKARASLPESYLTITQVDKEDAVIAKKRIPKRTQFGPLKGFLDVCKNHDLKTYKYLMLIGKYVYHVDVSDEENSNWMSFVRKATTYEQQNLILTQEGNGLYFTATRHIHPKEELRVGYSAAYARQFNLEILIAVGRKTWTCYECSEKFTSSQELQKHFSTHNVEKDEDKKATKKYRKSNLMVTSGKSTQVNIVECNTCHDMFEGTVSYNNLKKHLAEKHKCMGVRTGDHFSMYQCFQCNICNVQFKLDILLNIHKLEHDSELPLDQPHHVCPQCQRKFPTRKQLVLHVYSHALPRNITKDESVKCGICHRIFAQAHRLQKHMLCHGSDENKPLQCKVCKKRFLNISALSCHVKVHKVGEKHFECPICHERFDLVTKLKLHIPTHCINDKYACPHCKKTCTKYSILRKHLRFHRERNHHCTVCPKTFSTTDLLKKHLLRHSDVKEFLCADCGRQFKRKDKLTKHIKMHHSQLDDGIVAKERPPPKSKRVNAPKDFHRFIYKCHTCLVGFKRRGMLVNHLAKRHPEISLDSVLELNLPILQTMRDYYCLYCDKVYKSSSKRRVHILQKHPGAALPESNESKSNAPNGLTTSNSVTTRPKKCQWCHKQYARNSKLLSHIRHAHPSKILEDEAESKDGFEKETATVLNTASNTIDQTTQISKPLEQITKETLETSTFITNQNNEYHQNDILNKNQTTTDGNMTEITPAVIDSLMDEDLRYCHLSIDENETIPGGQMDNHNAHLYQLLSSNNGIIPSR